MGNLPNYHQMPRNTNLSWS